MENQKAIKIEFSPWRSIYPVFRWHKTSNPPKPPEFAGTGFFVQLGIYPVFITAGHVGLDPERQGEDFVLLISEKRGDCGTLIEVQGLNVVKESEDFNAYLFSKDGIELFTEKPIPLRLRRKLLNPLEDFFTFGFPFNQVVRADSSNPMNGETFRCNLDHLFLKGYIAAVRERKDITDLVPQAFGRSYILNIPSYIGMSGSPILVGTPDGPNVAGMIYGSLTPSFCRAPLEEETETVTTVNGSITTTTRLHSAYEFGVAATHETLLEFENILKGLKSNSTSTN